MTSNEDKLAVFTMAIGGEFDLPPITCSSKVDYICFTDQQKMDPNGWTIRSVSPLLPSDTVRSSRDVKIRPFRWLGNYSRSIYIDSRVQFLQCPTFLWNYLVPNEGVVFGAFLHSFRETLEDEFRAVGQKQLDYRATLENQLDAYRSYYPSVLSSKPVWGGVLARRHNSGVCRAAMEVWYANVLRFSRRDQLSLPVALATLSSGQLNLVEDSNHVSEFHTWTPPNKPRPHGYIVKDMSRFASVPGYLALRHLAKFFRKK